MRIFKYRTFQQWAKSEKLNDNSLRNAVDELEQGLFDAQLGSNVYKKRVARRGQGKRDGYRTIIAFKKHELAIFMYGYAKNERDNINNKEEIVYRKLAKYYLDLNDNKLNLLISMGELLEVVV